MEIHRKTNGKVEVLIVEDSPTQAAQLAHLLEQRGYSVTAAVNGREALALLERCKPSLVISDIVMPELDGYGLCKAIKADESLRDIPVMLVTTLSDPQDVIRGLECGADTFIRKPYDEHYLLARITYLLMNVELRKNQNMQMGLEIQLGGQRHFISSERQQILDLLISTYEQAVQINEDLKQREKELEHSNQVLNGLYRIADGLNHATSEREVVELALERALELPGIQAGWIFLREGESGFRLAAARNLPPALDAPGSMEGDCACRRRLISGELDHVTHIMECEWLEKAGGDTRGLRYHASVPLWIGDRTLGTMNFVGSEPGLFNEDALKVLHSVGNQVAVALERAHLHEHLERLVQERTAALEAEIVERKRIEKEQTRLVAIIEATSDMVATVGPDAIVLYCNPAGLHMIGFETGQDISNINTNTLYPDRAATMVREQAVPYAIEHGSWSGENVFLRPDGREIPVSQVIIAHRGSDGSVEYLSTIARDITLQKENEKRITRQNRIYTVLSGINTTIVRTENRQELFNEACRIAVEEGRFRLAWIGLLDANGLDVTPVARVGVDEGYLDNVHLTARENAPDRCEMVAQALREKTAVVCNDIDTDPQMARWRDEALRRGYRSVVVLPLQLVGKVTGLLLLYSEETGFFDTEEMRLLTEIAGDISFALDHLEKEDRLNYLAYYDTLTGLPNRSLLRDRTAQSLAVQQRADEALTIMRVAIDHFKSINDTVGHRIADGLLVKIAERLSRSVRDQGTVASVNGKEFALELSGMPAEGAAHLATELLWTLAQPYHLEGFELNLTASIGIASYPEDGSDFDALFKAAGIAMHSVQAGGRNDFKCYNADMYQQVQMADRMVRALRQAVALEQLQLVYQPLVDLQTGQISGLEALLRWQHPELGAVSPAQFIPLAEESGLINGIGEWVLRRACRDIRGWLDKGIKVPHVAINVSPLQFRDNNLIAQVTDALAKSQVDPALICVEVTESALMGDDQRNEVILKELKGLGVKLSLDDFGTGYSSLSYLKRFPFDKVKIDQSFVRDITTNPSDLVLVKVIISMAHGLGMKVVAEGVETESQCEIMRTSVCDEIQGYFFSKPISAQAIEELFTEGRQLPPHLIRFQNPKHTLLLVDDEPNILAALKRLLRLDGYVILTANSGAEGLDVLSRHKVDVIISDQRMPGMTGVEFLRVAKVSYPDTIRIVLSGYTELQSVTDAINEGAVYRFLTKPWEDEQLREHIQRVFKHKELLDENQQLDIRIRSTNQELVAANRQLSELLHKTRHQVERDETSLTIVREALQHIPLPVIAVDDEGRMAFVNSAAERLFASTSGPLLGLDLAQALPAIDTVIAGADEGAPCELLMDGTRFLVQWNVMGVNSRSRGRLVTLAKTGVMA